MCVWPLSLSTTFSRFVYMVAGVSYGIARGWGLFHPKGPPHCSTIHLLTDVRVATGLRVSLGPVSPGRSCPGFCWNICYTLWGYSPRNAMDTWYRESTFTLVRNCPRALHTSHTVRHSWLKPSVLKTHQKSEHALEATCSESRTGWNFLHRRPCLLPWLVEGMGRRGETSQPASQQTVVQSGVLQASLVSDPKLCWGESALYRAFEARGYCT